MNIEDYLTENELFWSIIVFLWAVYLWCEYLNSRQRKILSTKLDPVSSRVGEIMPEEKYSKARLYSLDKMDFEFYHEVYSMIETSVFLYFNLIRYCWELSLNIIGYNNSNNLNISQELNASMVFILLLTLYYTVSGMPWKLYRTFVIEQKHGFNKQTLGFFIKDKLKSLALSIVLTLPITYGILFIIKKGGPHFYFYVWIFAVTVSLFLMFIYPEFIAPLFDKYVLLPEGDLKTEIEALATRVEFPLTKLYVVEGSKRSSHSNAYFYGFWKNKRIVLFDTLVKGFKVSEDSDINEEQGCDNNEILAVLGHEIGHWKMNHTLQMMFVSQLNLFLLFFAFGLLINMEFLYQAFGFKGVNAPTIVRLMLVLSYFLSPYHFILNVVMTFRSRRNEFQADKFANDLGYSNQLCSALIKLQNDNLSFPIYDRYYSMFNHSHPPVLERIDAIIDNSEYKKEM